MTERRQALVSLPRQVLEEILQLPPGLHIAGVHDDWTNYGILVLVEGDALDPMPEEVVPPRLTGTWTAEAGRARWAPPFHR